MTPEKIQYSKAVDAHIYGPGPGEGCQTRGDWLALAEAARDQAESAKMWVEPGHDTGARKRRAGV